MIQIILRPQLIQKITTPDQMTRPNCSVCLFDRIKANDLVEGNNKRLAGIQNIRTLQFIYLFLLIFRNYTI